MKTLAKSFKVPETPLKIVNKLIANGHQAFVVGGCVRDLLMGVTPKDWDVVTSATPDEVEAVFSHTIPVGKSFGVIIVVIDSEEFEVATFRGESDYVDGRRPENVYFTNAEEDVKRRDFTVNSLLYNPVEHEIIDYVGGLEDLENKVIRAVGTATERFQEDHLRLLRAVRFTARTGFNMEPETWEAVCENAQLITTVSAERIFAELTRMLSEGYSYTAIKMLNECGLLKHILPEITRMIGVEQPPQYHPEGDVWEHTLVGLQKLDEIINGTKTLSGYGCDNVLELDEKLFLEKGLPRIALGWATLLHDVGKPETMTISDRIRFNYHDKAGEILSEKILERLKASNHLKELVAELVGGHMKFMHIKNMRQAKKRRMVQNENFALHLVLHIIDCLSSHSELDLYEYALNQWELEMLEPDEPNNLISGHDLIKLGYKAGPLFTEILNSVSDAQLEKTVKTKEDALKWVLTHYPKE